MKHLFILSGIFLYFSAVCQSPVHQYEIFETRLKADCKGNPFSDTRFQAIFVNDNDSIRVSGFYDGNNTYVIRFMPAKEGRWVFRTESNIKSLNGKTGSFSCIPPRSGIHGLVKVRDTFHFAYSDGSRFMPVGTTCYQWVFQGNPEQTIQTLSKAPFNKIRMCVFPKKYDVYINNEPTLYPFEGSKEKGWDFSRPDPEYFRFFEKQVGELMKLGIEADVILFHPYDYGNWGFDRMPQPFRLQYIKYLTARLSAYRNVWWSLANEYEYLRYSVPEWEEIFHILLENDPYSHLCSIHNGENWYDVSKPYITHLSVQGTDFFHIQEWRMKYHKPVIMDEFVYEGDLPNDWGNIPAEEFMHRCWTIYTRGGYFTHGETYDKPDKILWWSKGGVLYGQSPQRIGFLKSIMEEVPDGVIPHCSVWNKETYLKKPGEFYLFYYGISQQKSARLYLPEHTYFNIEIIDTWNMNREKLNGSFHGETLISLPGRSYMALIVRKK